ncbi:MAG: type II toxin-antitoxin system HicB family antitoxin [Dehalococcoidia bacterium]|nr:type II toxin-antitoxin system HicB family antitoxin [Dehalococcoidia bacterium]
MQLNLRIEIFKEDDQYAAIAPELNVSSFGDSPDEAKSALAEAVELFLEECKRMGTLEDVLTEAGFKLDKRLWESPRPLVIEQISLAI